ncbi:P-loop NTPase fold protein [Pseudomonas caspiana]|uniref:KAP family P-loop NTPase fold protein n=1 Tax=Pseudomonas caspiana TaxID=1451454 RepID=UPI0032EE5033
MSEPSNIWDDDMMDRKASSAFLTSYLLANDHVHVLNVNSPWGAGKSFFLKRWAESLSEHHVCVSFNAWETDYSTEPLVALVTCIEQQTADPLQLDATKTGKSLIAASSTLIKKATPLILKGLVRKVSGVELDEIFGEGGEDAATSIVESLIKEQAETAKNVEDFKSEVLKRLAAAAENQKKSAPAFIFIDELDRCRPTYAIELLERVKHFFELSDCRFIIASDSEQLAHSIRAVYGAGFSSEKYLNRFFDAEFRLDNTDIFKIVSLNLPVIPSLVLGVNVTGDVSRHRYNDTGKESAYPRANTIISKTPGFTENALIVVALSKYFRVELREMINYFKQLKSASDSLKGEVNFFWLAFLIFAKSTRPQLYQALFSDGKSDDAFKAMDLEANVVTLSFTSSLAEVSDIARFYLRLINSERDELNRISSSLSGWQDRIYYSVVNELPKLYSYKSVVELAHRLT